MPFWVQTKDLGVFYVDGMYILAIWEFQKKMSKFQILTIFDHFSNFEVGQLQNSKKNFFLKSIRFGLFRP